MGTYSIDSVQPSTKFNNDARQHILRKMHSQEIFQDNALIPEDQEINDLVLNLTKFRYQVYFLYSQEHNI